MPHKLLGKKHACRKKWCHCRKLARAPIVFHEYSAIVARRRPSARRKLESHFATSSPSAVQQAKETYPTILALVDGRYPVLPNLRNNSRIQQDCSQQPLPLALRKSGWMWRQGALTVFSGPSIFGGTKSGSTAWPASGATRMVIPLEVGRSLASQGDKNLGQRLMAETLQLGLRAGRQDVSEPFEAAPFVTQTPSSR